MSDISAIGPGGTGNFGSVGPVSRAQLNGVHHAADRGVIDPSPAQSSAAASDRVELSNFAVYLDKLRQMPSTVGPDRVGSVQQAIKSGTYETPVKLDIALERLIDQLED